MNVVDYLFENSKDLNKQLILGRHGTATYQEIYSHVQTISSFLRNKIGEEKNILLMGDNSPFLVAAYLGIIQSGNVCVPLDPNVSGEVFDYIIQTCKPAITFVQEKYENRFENYYINLFNETRFNALLKSDSIENFPDIIDEEFDQNRLAEILFTSGSTALPKGVMLTHENILANTQSIIEYLHLSEKDRMEVVLPFYYCYGLSLLHTHIRVGGSLVLNNKFMFLSTVIDDLQEYQCTGFAGVPSHFQMLLRKSPDFITTEFPNLKYVTQAGGKLADPFIKDFVETFPEVDFFVMYGQTEATARLSYLPPEMLGEKLGSLGKGIPGVKLEVLNKNGQHVRPGEIGEIVATGQNVMKGYLNDSALTSKTIKDRKLYTGDIATIDEDGYIFIVAREKEFIKVGGERVSPKEIEKVITSLQEVVDCSIIGVEDELLGEALKAIIVLQDGNEEYIIEEEIKSACAEKLGFHKVPKYFQFIDKIPMSDTGKKKALKLKQFS